MHTYEEAFASSLNYFGGDELAAKVFLDKYALRDTEGTLMEATPADMHWRIARELARVERDKYGDEAMTEEEIFGYLDGFKKIVPQGSPMYAVGNPYQYVSASNCFVTDSPLDSYSSIMQTDEQLVQISKRRGGVGVDLSNIRPANTRTTNAARSSTGIVPFMKRYSNSIREVGQNARRGALITTLDVRHPEVLDFAHAKDNGTDVTGANISIRLYDEFLNAVKARGTYRRRWPINAEKPTISEVVDARATWMEIIECAHRRAEPGILFWDRITSESPADCYEDFQTLSTNPCVSSSGLVLTKNGIRTIGDVNIGDEIWSREGWTKITAKWSTGFNYVYRYSTNAGTFCSTELHPVFNSGEKTEALSAESVDILTGPYIGDIKHIDQAVMDGLVIGDGTHSPSPNGTPYLHIGRDDQDYLTSDIFHLIGRRRDGLNEYAYEVITGITNEELPHLPVRRIPQRYIQGSRDVVASFLRGLYSANGSICGGRVTLKSSSLGLIKDVQVMLSSLGIQSYYTTNKPSTVKFKNGTYTCKQSYDLNISFDRTKFVQLIGFIQEYKNERIQKVIESLGKPSRSPKTCYEINQREFVATEETFDISVDNITRSFWLSGCDVSNCGEIPLSKFDSCRLLCLNLYGYVNSPFTNQAQFDFDRFYQDAQIAQRLMDDIVDIELECLDRIMGKVLSDPEPDHVKATELNLWKMVKKAGEDGRRTGTGITALGDTLAALGIRYGSDESIGTTEKIYKTLKLGCYRSSVDMAKKLGTFPVWDYEKEKNNPFLLRIAEDDPQLYEDMKKYGRRNIALLTTAPTGSVSTMTQTSSGIEPVFMLSYTRRKKINHDDVQSRVDFTDPSGDKWQEFPVYHPKFKIWMDVSGETAVEKSPYYQACAEEINWKQRVILQARANNHVDHAISATLNLPEEATVEQVAEIYETAWEAGCKGITVYRKNCRTGVLVETSNAKAEVPEKLTKTKAPKRPKSLPCDIHRSSVDGSKFFMVVSLLDGDPYEVIAGEASLPRRQMTTGYCVKAKKGVYRLDNEEGETLLDNAVDHCTEDQEALLRMVSTSLRHGAEIRFVVEQLEKTRGSLYSFAKMLARNLKKYIPDHTPVSGAVCESCQSSNIVRQEGCQTCLSCGASKCG